MTPLIAIEIWAALSRQRTAGLDAHQKTCRECVMADYGYCPEAQKLLVEAMNPKPEDN